MSDRSRESRRRLDRQIADIVAGRTVDGEGEQRPALTINFTDGPARQLVGGLTLISRRSNCPSDLGARALQPLRDAAAGTPAIECQHQTRKLRRAAKRVSPQAERTTRNSAGRCSAISHAGFKISDHRRTARCRRRHALAPAPVDEGVIVGIIQRHHLRAAGIGHDAMDVATNSGVSASRERGAPRTLPGAGATARAALVSSADPACNAVINFAGASPERSVTVGAAGRNTSRYRVRHTRNQPMRPVRGAQDRRQPSPPLAFNRPAGSGDSIVPTRARTFATTSHDRLLLFRRGRRRS
jgi:hypothetical protein